MTASAQSPCSAHFIRSDVEAVVIAHKITARFAVEASGLRSITVPKAYGGAGVITRPTLVLLDEPSMGLAPIIVQEIFEIVAQLSRDEQVSFLIAEQNINVALKYASTAYVLDTGRVVLSGSSKALLTRGNLHDFYSGEH